MGIFASFSWVVASFLSGFSVGFFGFDLSNSYLMSPQVLDTKYVANAVHLFARQLKQNCQIRVAYFVSSSIRISHIMFPGLYILHTLNDTSWLLVHLIYSQLVFRTVRNIKLIRKAHRFANAKWRFSVNVWVV